jgi:hypothetical protein
MPQATAWDALQGVAGTGVNRLRFIASSIITALLVLSSIGQVLAQAQSCKPAAKASRMKITHADVPLYPALAVQSREQGTVRLHLLISDGVVVKVESVSSQPGDLKVLPSAAAENARSWHFSSKLNAETEATFIYKLTPEESYLPENARVEMELPSCVWVTSKSPKPMMDTIDIKKPK